MVSWQKYWSLHAKILTMVVVVVGGGVNNYKKCVTSFMSPKD